MSFWSVSEESLQSDVRSDRYESGLFARIPITRLRFFTIVQNDKVVIFKLTNTSSRSAF